MWVHLALELLTVKKLVHALAVKLEEETLDTEGFTEVEDMLEATLRLLVVDEETSIARLVHLCLSEYLTSHHHSLFPSSHSVMAQTCLTYLSFKVHLLERRPKAQDFKNLSQEYVFWAYAAFNWARHVSMQSDESVQDLVIRFIRHTHDMNHPTLHHEMLAFLTQYHSTFKTMFKAKISTYNYGYQPINGLHAIAYNGLENIAEVLLAKPVPVLNVTPWSVCAQGQAKKFQANPSHGSVDVLKRKALNMLDANCGKTPLFWAALQGYQFIVRLLFEAGASANAENKTLSPAHQGTPTQGAAS